MVSLLKEIGCVGRVVGPSFNVRHEKRDMQARIDCGSVNGPNFRSLGSFPSAANNLRRPALRHRKLGAPG